jgi:hypothetical protein
MLGHVSDGIIGARLAGEQPTETRNGASIVHIATALITMLQMIQACFSPMGWWVGSSNRKIRDGIGRS